MKLNFENKDDAVEFVNDLRQAFPNASQSITITTPEKSGACSVLIATSGSSDDTEQEQVAKFFSDTQVNT